MSSYHRTLWLTTRGGAIAGTIIFLCLAIYYKVSGYPTQVIWLQMAAMLMGASAILVSLTRFTRAAAHLATAAIFLSLVGPGVYAGGINSSSVVWLVFVPVAATVMGGTANGLFWSIASIVAVMGLYLFDQAFIVGWTARPPQSLDRAVELVLSIMGAGVVLLFNEQIKRRHMVNLDGVQAQLTELAEMDPLTHVLNRRSFIRKAESELARSGEGRGFSILLLDVDHFKRINDTYGHNIGDKVLNRIVTICSPALRKEDILARMGGEEFIALLPNTAASAATEVAERLRKLVQNTSIDTKEGTVNITVSIGVSSYSPTETSSVQELIRRADEAMYKAKEAGRNRVVAWSSETQA